MNKQDPYAEIDDKIVDRAKAIAKELEKYTKRQQAFILHFVEGYLGINEGVRTEEEIREFIDILVRIRTDHAIIEHFYPDMIDTAEWLAVLRWVIMEG